MADALLLTCEHASGDVPRAERHLFAGASAERALNSHRGVDIGALKVARRFGRAFRLEVTCGTVTRLLVDLNRSPSHPRVFSEYSGSLSVAEKEGVLQQYYWPYRARVSERFRLLSSRSRVVHVSVHSFTPRLAGKTRHADVGLLYDPARAPEADFALRWQQQLAKNASWLVVRRNYPYRGYHDGLTTSLRKVARPENYLGLELELNQYFFKGRRQHLAEQLTGLLIQTLRAVLA